MIQVVLAAEGIGALGINLPGLVAQLINFTVLLLLFSWVFKKFLFPALDERKRRIEEGHQASEEAKQRLSQTEQEIAKELDKARQEGQQLVAQAQQVSIRIQEEARQSARSDAENLLERAFIFSRGPVIEDVVGVAALDAGSSPVAMAGPNTPKVS